jgi:hypothetical protein
MPRPQRKKKNAYRGPLSPFEFGLMVLKAYVGREGHADVPVAHRERAFAFHLGKWVSRQRYRHRRHLLTPEQVHLLNKVKDWRWARVYQLSFQEALRRLAAYAKHHGHTRVPQLYRDGTVALGTWVARARKEYRKGTLPPQKVRALEALPRWSWDPFGDHFDERLRNLRAFVRRHGHVPVGQDRDKSVVSLNDWMVRLRGDYRSGRLEPERCRLLEAIPGWSWDPRDDWFQRGFASLRRFVKRTGHSRVPTTHVEAGFKLGPWVIQRRADGRRGRLPRERVRLLEQLPGWAWSTRRSGKDAKRAHAGLRSSGVSARTSRPRPRRAAGRAQ